MLFYFHIAYKIIELSVIFSSDKLYFFKTFPFGVKDHPKNVFSVLNMHFEVNLHFHPIRKMINLQTF